MTYQHLKGTLKENIGFTKCRSDQSHKSQLLGLATAAHVQLSVIRLTREWSLRDGMVGLACNCCGQQAEITLVPAHTVAGGVNGSGAGVAL